jgi:hypothetical protein
MAEDDKVVNLAAWKNKDSRVMAEYLRRRAEADDLRGLFVISIDRKGRERVHATGELKDDSGRALATILSLSVKMTAAAGGFDEPTRY